MSVTEIPIDDSIVERGDSRYLLHNDSGGGADLSNVYQTTDSASTTINDTDYVPLSTSNGTKKKSLWSTIVAKIKDALTKSDVGLGNVANIDQSSAVSSITANQSAFQYTLNHLDGSVSTLEPLYQNTDVNVTQTNTTTSSDYRVLLSGNANDTTETTTARKSTNLKFNPFTGNLQATQLNGVTIGSNPKFTDTTVATSAEVNVVTQNANTTGEASRVVFQEFAPGANYNLPESSGRYHIITFRGPTYRSQLALGVVSTQEVFYRRYSGSAWQSWIRLNSTTVSQITGTAQTSLTTSFGTYTEYNAALNYLLNNDLTLNDKISTAQSTANSASSTASAASSDITTLKSKKSKTQSSISITSQNYKDISISVSDATFGIIKGYQVSSSPYVMPIQLYFDGLTAIKVRLINYMTASQTCSFTVWYI